MDLDSGDETLQMGFDDVIKLNMFRNKAYIIG
jgi:hypothetical protein